MDYAVIRNPYYDAGRPYLRVVYDLIKGLDVEVLALNLSWEEAGDTAERLCVLSKVIGS